MADADVHMGEGDSLPLFKTTLFGADGQPLDLTGCTTTFEVARQEGGTAVVRPVTADPDQVTNRGDVVVKVFDRGVSMRGFYDGRFTVIDGNGEQISVLNDRLIVIEVTRKPGT